jgi:hypothetical protein
MRPPRVQFTVRPTMIAGAVVVRLLVPALALAQGLADRRFDPGGVQFRRAVAEADRLHPGWKLKDLEAKRVRPAAGRNSAEVLGSTAEFFSLATAAERDALGAATEPDAKQRLDATVKKALTAFVERNHAVLPALRSLVDRPTGRFVYQVKKNHLEIPLTYAQTLRDQVRLLLSDAMLRLDDGDADGALSSCRAAVCAARSLFDEPFAISQLVRVACQAQTQMAILVVLARGRPSDRALTLTQQLIADEVDQPISRIALFGERATMFETLGHLADGSLTLDEITGTVDTAKKFPAEFQGQFVRSGLFRASQGVMLERMTRMVDVVMKPSWTWHEGIARLEQWIGSLAQADRKRKPEEIVPDKLFPSTSPLIRGELRTDALGDSLVLLIAARRYDMTHAQWPTSAEVLVPEYLKAVPTDPMTGKPMRLVIKGDRLIAYSSGVNGRDDGGEVAGSSRQGVEKSADVGFGLPIHRTR